MKPFAPVVDGMPCHIVLYREPGMGPDIIPLVFTCYGDDLDHVEDQTEEANPGCEIVWIYQGNDINLAFEAWWGSQ